MELTTALSAGATLVSLAAGLAILERWLQRRTPHLACWGISLVLFAAGTGVLWAGIALGWNEGLFKAFYLLGGILNVLFLALGSVYFIARDKPRVFSGALWSVMLFSALSTGVLWAAPAKEIEAAENLPQGSEVFGALPRILVALGSSAGALVVFGIAAFSIWQYLKQKNSNRNRLWGAGLVAVGTLVLSAGGIFNSAADQMSVFTASILIGVTFIFAGFLASDTSAS